MKTPGKLVATAIQAGNEAIADYARGTTFADGIHAEVCRRAVAAAFAALPGSQEAEHIRQAILDSYGSVSAEGTAPSPGAVVDAVFTALYREFGT